MIKRYCPNCQEPITAKKKERIHTCAKCKAKLALCPLNNCNHVWVPRKEKPIECPKCKRYLPNE